MIPEGPAATGAPRKPQNVLEKCIVLCTREPPGGAAGPHPAAPGRRPGAQKHTYSLGILRLLETPTAAGARE